MNEKLKKILIPVIAAGTVLLSIVISGYIIASTGAWAFAIIPLIFAAIIAGYYIFKNPFLGFLLITFFLPFERVPTAEFGGVNIKINTILGFVTIFAWLLASLFNGKKWKIQPNALSIPIALFVMALILSLTQALNIDRAISVIIFVLFTITLSIMTVNMISDQTNLKKTVLILFLSGFVVSIFGLFQFGGDTIGLPATITLLKKGYDSSVFGFPRIQAFSMEPLYFANYLLIPLSLALAYYMSKVNIIKHWWLATLIVLLLINFILTVSRGGYLGLIATLLIFIIFYFRKVFTWRNLGVAIIFLAAAYGVFFALSRGEYRATSEFIKHATVQDAKKGESVQGRLNTFEVAMQAFYKNPILGIGIGNYGPYMKNYPPQTPKTGWDIVNNEYIEVIVETGLVGGIAFGLILLFAVGRSLLALKYTQDPLLKATLIGLLAAFVGILIQYNFFSTLYIIHIWILIGMLVAVQNLCFKSKTPNERLTTSATNI